MTQFKKEAFFRLISFFNQEKMTPKHDKIPFPEYESHLHKRCNLPVYSLEKYKEWWSQQSYGQKVFDSVLSRLIIKTGLAKGNRAHVFFKLFQKGVKFYFKIYNRLKVFGLENVPKNGTIFYVNHPGSYDPLILVAALPIQTGAFVAWNYSWFMNFINLKYGFITKIRFEDRQTIVEKIVRQILTKNHYFAIWPEGHPNGSGLVEQGFSSVVRLYSVINHDKDRIPFTPVLIRGGGVYLDKPGIHRGPIDIHVLKPYYLNRKWIKPIEEGGKTPREIVDFMMLKIANAQGQKKLATNLLLESRKIRHTGESNAIKFHMGRHFWFLHRKGNKRYQKVMNNIYNIIKHPKPVRIKNQTITKGNINDFNLINRNGEIPIVNRIREEYIFIKNYKCECLEKIEKINKLIPIEQHLVWDGDDSYDIIICKCSKCNKELKFGFKMQNLVLK